MISLREQVEATLKMYPDTRGDDRKLAVQIWDRWFDAIFTDEWMNTCIIVDKFFDLPSIESIGRWRRKFQESGKYLPDDTEITKKRKAHSKTWKKELGYPTKDQVVGVKVAEKQGERHINSISGSLFQ